MGSSALLFLGTLFKTHILSQFFTMLETMLHISFICALVGFAVCLPMKLITKKMGLGLFPSLLFPQYLEQCLAQTGAQ